MVACEVKELRRFRRGNQKGRHLRFLPSWDSRFPLFPNLVQPRDRRPLRNRGTAEDFFYRRGAQCAPISLPIRSVRYRTATHMGNSTLGAAQGELPEGQERVPWGMTVPRNSFVGCSLCIPSNFTFIFHSPVSIFYLVLFTLNSPLFTLYKTPISSLLTPTLRNLSHLDTCILRQLLLSYKDVRSD